jgi:hypothetical protein
MEMFMTPTNQSNRKLEPTFKYTVPFTADANNGLLHAAEKSRMEPTEIIQRATIKFLITEGHIKEPEATHFRLFWEIVDQCVLAAQDICSVGKFESSITLDAIEVCMKDTAWLDKYRTYVKDDIFKSGNPRKGPINREIGFRIRAGIGGITEKGADGKAKTAKVLGKIIQSYTPMSDYDRAAFGPRAI